MGGEEDEKTVRNIKEKLMSLLKRNFWFPQNLILSSLVTSVLIWLIYLRVITSRLYECFVLLSWFFLTSHFRVNYKYYMDLGTSKLKRILLMTSFHLSGVFYRDFYWSFYLYISLNFKFLFSKLVLNTFYEIF